MLTLYFVSFAAHHAVMVAGILKSSAPAAANAPSPSNHVQLLLNGSGVDVERFKCARPDLHRQPNDYESFALTIELLARFDHSLNVLQPVSKASAATTATGNPMNADPTAMSSNVCM